MGKADVRRYQVPVFRVTEPRGESLVPGTGQQEVDAVFDALGDPGRRALVASVADRGTATATELAAELPVTRQAVAKQLVTLADAGLLHATRVGRETRYTVTPQPLGDAAAWLVEMGGRWDERLTDLGRSLARCKTRAGWFW